MKRLLALMLCAVSLEVGAQTTTFNVDMTCAPDFDNVFVTGPWCGWCAENGYNTMTDPDGDGVYTVVIEDLVGTVEYKYAVDGFTSQENLVNDMIDGATCAPFTDFNAYANRQTTQGTINNDSYGTCDGVCNDQPPTDVTFRIDMSGYEGSNNPANVTWNSEANNWCGSCAPMEAVGGDVYTLTVPLTGDTVEYKFAIGNWVDQEDLEPGATCAVTTYDEGAPNGCCYVNRFVALGCGDTIEMPLVCWNSCEDCDFAPTPGCTDVNACNYLVAATEDDGSCEYESCAGCTDVLACNYDPVAWIENGSCEYSSCADFLTLVDVVFGSEDHTILANAIIAAGIEEVLNGEGAFTLFAPTDDAFNAFFDALAISQDEFLAMTNVLVQILAYHIVPSDVASLYFDEGLLLQTLHGEAVMISIVNDIIYINGSSTVTLADMQTDNGFLHVIDFPLVPEQIAGCTDQGASNYDGIANFDDGSCEFAGCTDQDASNYDLIANFDDGSCEYFFPCGGSAGCTDPLACNFDSLAISENGSCLFFGDACDDSNEMTFDDVVNVDCLCEGQELVDEGCTVPIACNYNPYAINDDNSCVFVCPGCTDPVACNFDAGALQEDGTCAYPEDSGWCNCEGAVDDALGICGGTCDFDQDGDGVCDDVDDCIGIVDACGICNGPGAIYPCGCDDFPEGSCSCDGLTLVDQCGVCDGDGTSCVGCTYDFACNYDPEATIQDASQCEFGTCAGCLDPLACNYNPTVNGDDGSCEYPAFYLDCAGNCLNDANGNGVCDENEIFGCAYPSACNYDPQVTADDGSCDYSCVESFCEADFDFGVASWVFSPDPNNGESFEVGTVNLAYADVLHGLFPLVAGEIDPAYPPELPIDSVLLLYGVLEDGLITNVLFTDVETNENFFSEDLGFVLTLNNPNGGVSPRTVLPEEQFCVSILGVPEREGNYRISFPFEAWSTLFTPFSVPYVFEFPLSVITATIGCMDPNACNYQPTAVEDDGSCGVFDECGVCAGLGIPESECDCYGNVVDAVGVCGGDCPSDFNTNGICDSDEVFGCTYDSAENYDPEATSDDGTCIGFEGANVSSCLFDGDGNGGVGSGDLLGLLSEFGNVCD